MIFRLSDEMDLISVSSQEMIPKEALKHSHIDHNGILI